MADTTWYQVTLPYFCCGLAVMGGRVTEAAPIMKWAVGKPWITVERWIIGKRGRYIAV